MHCKQNPFWLYIGNVYLLFTLTMYITKHNFLRDTQTGQQKNMFCETHNSPSYYIWLMKSQTWCEMKTHFCTVRPRKWKMTQNLWGNLLKSIYVRERECQSTSIMMKLLLCLELSIRTKQSYGLLLYKLANQSLLHLLIDSNYKMTTTGMCVLYYGPCRIFTANQVMIMWKSPSHMTPVIKFISQNVWFFYSMEEYFVLLQWYDQVGRQPLDSVSGLVQLVLRPPNDTSSYSFMPITSIVNGAIITCSEKKFGYCYLRGKRLHMN